METGRTVILLNLESLYESLYDALNQVCVYPLLKLCSFLIFIFMVELHFWNVFSQGS